MDDLITIDKAVKWLNENVYPGFDSMCLDYRKKDDCIKQFIEDMKNPNYGKHYGYWDDEW